MCLAVDYGPQMHEARSNVNRLAPNLHLMHILVHGSISDLDSCSVTLEVANVAG